MKLTLPIPPSANTIFRNVPGRGRVKTAAYVKWRADAALGLRVIQKAGHIDGPVAIHIRVKRLRKNSDIDNRIKPTLDALVEAGVIEDDRHVQRVSAEWADDVATCEVEVVRA